MRVLFVSGELIGSAVVHQLVNEGHEVRLYIDHEDRKPCLEGFVKKVDDWKEHLEWVGFDGLVIFDDVVFNNEQNRLRRAGYSVFGGDSRSDKLELDREYFQETLEVCGVKTLPSYNFSSISEAEEFVRNNPQQWVIKQSNHIGMLAYVGQCEDGQDVLSILESYRRRQDSPVHLQKRVKGVEIAVGRYFNGKDWIGPLEVNIEHKPLCNGDIGPLTAEMGTLAWFDNNESLPIFQETLAKIKGHLRSINYKGDVDINCIANEEGVWPLEATMRQGTPATELHCEMFKSPWGDLLKAIADGESYELDYHDGYGIVISIAVPPFPFAPEVFGNSNIETCEGVEIFFKDIMTNEQLNHVHFEEVSAKTTSKGRTRYFIAGKHGYTLYVTGRGKTVTEAQTSAYGVVDSIVIPKMFYRTDIGEKFIRQDYQQLKNWGWI